MYATGRTLRCANNINLVSRRYSSHHSFYPLHLIEFPRLTVHSLWTPSQWVRVFYAMSYDIHPLIQELDVRLILPTLGIRSRCPFVLTYGGSSQSPVPGYLLQHLPQRTTLGHGCRLRGVCILLKVIESALDLPPQPPPLNFLSPRLHNRS